MFISVVSIPREITITLIPILARLENFCETFTCAEVVGLTSGPVSSRRHPQDGSAAWKDSSRSVQTKKH